MRLMLVVWASLGVFVPATLAKDHLNVLFIIADDLNCDLGCYGHPVARSPHLDQLAQQGVRFERAYVQYTICNPSRTSFLTGLRPETTHILGNGAHFRSQLPRVITLPQQFRQQGYYTASVGKVFHRGGSPDEKRPERDDPPSWNHRFYGDASPSGRRGTGRNLTNGKLRWCRWLAAEGSDVDQHDGQVTTEAIRLLETPRTQPFFLAVGYYRPHDPFISPKKYFDLYDRSQLPLPPTPSMRSRDIKYALPRGGFADAFAKFTDRERREFLHAYYAGVSFMDAQVGRLLAALDRLRLADKTIVVFLGDHGYELGYRNWWNKNTLFERCCRTPLIVRWPGATGNGQSCAGLVEFIDLYPTLTDLCGLPRPENLAGRSFRKLLDTPSAQGKDAAFTTVRRGRVTGLSVRIDRFRYTEWDAGKQGVELYDHTTDPNEWHNLAGDLARQVTQKQLHQHLAKFRDRYSRRSPSP